MAYYYVLDGHEPVAVEGRATWDASSPNDRIRQVARTADNDICISTVFLGINHQWGDGPPLVFETFAVAPNHPEIHGAYDRYSSWDEAKAGHRAMVERVTAAVAGLAVDD